jgi:hypothetical protein
VFSNPGSWLAFKFVPVSTSPNYLNAISCFLIWCHACALCHNFSFLQFECCHTHYTTLLGYVVSFQIVRERYSVRSLR